MRTHILHYRLNTAHSMASFPSDAAAHPAPSHADIRLGLKPDRQKDDRFAQELVWVLIVLLLLLFLAAGYLFWAKIGSFWPFLC